eukprot:1465199-Amphidinium_carterae.1
MEGNESTTRKQILARVNRGRLELYCLPERYRADREIVLAAVKQNGNALEYAAEECKADREIVLAAVQGSGPLSGWALRYATEECQADHEIVLAAVQQDPDAIEWASDGLLLDSTFAPDAKSSWYILKVYVLSGRSTVVCACDEDEVRDGQDAEMIVERCCMRLMIFRTGNEKLVHGAEVVPETAIVGSWPGIRPKGEVSEYQLVI